MGVGMDVYYVICLFLAIFVLFILVFFIVLYCTVLYFIIPN